MDQAALASPDVLSNDVPTVQTTPTIIPEAYIPPPPIVPPPSTPIKVKPHHPLNGTLLAIFIVTISTFTIGLTGTVGYYKYFNDSVPLPTTSTGMLLGISDTPEEIIATPSATPAPSLVLSPEKVEKPLAGTLAYIQNNQVYTIKADRTDPLRLTKDETKKQDLAVSPDGLTIAYTFRATIPELAKNKTGSGIAVINRQTKEEKALLEPDQVTYSELSFSPSGKYLTAWIDQGSESIIIELESAKIISRYGTAVSDGGVSPLVFLPGRDQISFILKNELFVADPDGKNLKSLALDVLGIKPVSENQALPLSPVWSKDGKNVAFHRTTGLMVLIPESKQELPILTVAKAIDPDKITWRAQTFTDSASHLIYEDYAALDNQTVQVYSLAEKKNVGLSDISDTILLNPTSNELLGLPPKNTHEPTLEKYSFNNWKLTSCSASDFRFIRPAVLPAFGNPDPISPDGNGLVGFAKSTGSLSTVKLINLPECIGYDLVKAENISEILWLPN